MTDYILPDDKMTAKCTIEADVAATVLGPYLDRISAETAYPDLTLFRGFAQYPRQIPGQYADWTTTT
jgi:hypothetical protein